MVDLEGIRSKLDTDEKKKGVLRWFFIERKDHFYELISKHIPLENRLLYLFEASINGAAASWTTQIQWDFNTIEKNYNKYAFNLESGGSPLGKIR